MVIKRACAKCDYWEKEQSLDGNRGSCRRYPPKTAEHHPIVTYGTSWCGEFQPRSEPAGEKFPGAGSGVPRED
jgi:hypothetical protein